MALGNVLVLLRTTALGAYDDGAITALQREPLGVAARLWHIRARQVIHATGAQERPIAFADNDRPGVMSASAAGAYARRYGVAVGRNVVVWSTDDSGLRSAVELATAGVTVVAVVEARSTIKTEWQAQLDAASIPVHLSSIIASTSGDSDGVLVGVALRAGPRTEHASAAIDVRCDVLAVAGGWDPAIALLGHVGGRLSWNAVSREFEVGPLPTRHSVAGAAAGNADVASCITSGTAAGHAAADACELPPADPGPIHSDDGPDSLADHLDLFTSVEVPPGTDQDASLDHAYVDLHRDATITDVRRAIGAGLRSMEHVKRYTLIGTAPDQGRTSNTLALGVTATLLGISPSSLGPTTARPPTIPVPFGAIAGRYRGPRYDPERVTSIHDDHVLAGAIMEPVGQWLRPRYFPGPGEDMEQAVLRECRAVRQRVAIADVSTLGKIDVQGPDAAEFLDRIYTNKMSSLAVGACRYGLMLRSDGMVFDDGVCCRIEPERFHLTTTTGGSAGVIDWMEEWLQTEWPELRVHLTSVTEQWAVTAVSGPRARDVLARVAPGLELSIEGFPMMATREAEVSGIPARVTRVSFSGELAYEVGVPWWAGQELWGALLSAGEPLAIERYGLEAIHVLRAEKGYVIVGQETDGSVTPIDLGLSGLLSTKKPFLGQRSLQRAAMLRPDRKQLVGLLSVDPEERIREGAQLVNDPAVAPPVPMVGHVTSSYRSAELGRTFALALLEAGRERHGDVVNAWHLGAVVPAVVTEPVFVDPEGTRKDG